MSQQNVDLIRAAVERYNRDGIDGIMDFVHPDAVAYPFPEWLGETIYRGQAGWRRLITEWTESFDDFKWEIEDVIDASDEVVALMRIRARIKGTQVPISQPVGALLSDFRGDDLIAEGHFFLTFAEALDAAGLPARSPVPDERRAPPATG